MDQKSNGTTYLSIQPVIVELETKISKNELDIDSYSSILKKLRRFNRDHLKIFINQQFSNVFIFMIDFTTNGHDKTYFSQKNLDHTMSVLANLLSITEARKSLINKTSNTQKFNFMDSILKIFEKNQVNNDISLIHRAIRLLANISVEKEVLVFYSGQKIDVLLKKLANLVQNNDNALFLIDVVRCIRVLASHKNIRALIVDQYLDTVVTVSNLLIQTKSTK